MWFASRFSPSEVDRDREVEIATYGLLRGLVGWLFHRASHAAAGIRDARSRCTMIIQYNNIMIKVFLRD